MLTERNPQEQRHAAFEIKLAPPALIAVTPAERRALFDLLDAGRAPRFPVTYCSQCGSQFGPGDAGFSDCRDHRSAAELRAIRDHHMEEMRCGLDAVGPQWERDDDAAEVMS